MTLPEQILGEIAMMVVRELRMKERSAIHYNNDAVVGGRKVEEKTAIERRTNKKMSAKLTPSILSKLCHHH
jgi:hypothetical protein